MTVEELIKQLNKCNPTMEVRVYQHETYAQKNFACLGTSTGSLTTTNDYDDDDTTSDALFIEMGGRHESGPRYFV